MTGKIVDVWLQVYSGRVTAIAEIQTERNRAFSLPFPRRELAALLPRSILQESLQLFPQDFARTAETILRSLSVGRKIRIRKRNGRKYFTFLLWDTVLPGDESHNGRIPLGN